jgi:hypothetical protein
MEIFIVLAYPVVFLHGKLRKSPKLEKDISPINFWVNVPISAEAGK